MIVRFDTRSAEDYRKFLYVRRCPVYQFRGNAAVVPDEYAAAIGHKVRKHRTKAYEPAITAFDYQSDITRIAIQKRKYAIFADCGLGKTLMLLEYARHVVAVTGGKVMIVSPLMVVRQTIEEARRWYGDGLPIGRVTSADLGEWLTTDGGPQIGVTNYEAIRDDLTTTKLAGIILDE